MKRTLLFFTTLALCAVSCGTVGTYADSDRFQDGIYYKPDPTNVSRTPLSEEDFRYNIIILLQIKLFIPVQ